jgi:hypothetical protein
MALAPRTVQNIPERLRREATTVVRRQLLLSISDNYLSRLWLKFGAGVARALNRELAATCYQSFAPI